MNRKLLLVAFLATLALTILAAGHQLTNAAANMAPPPQHAPRIDASPVRAWKVIAGGGGKDIILTDVSMSSSTDGWAVGLTGPSSYGVIMQYNGSGWSRQTVPTGTYSLNAVQMTSSTAGWAVGCSPASDPAVLMQYSNGTWQRVSVPSPGNADCYTDIDIKGNAGWAIGYGYALKFNGASWTPVAIPYNTHTGVSVIDGTNAWAVGNGDKALQYTGSNWSSTSLGLPPTLTTVRMQSIHMLNANEGWAVGYAAGGTLPSQCVLVHSTGTWSNVTCPFSNYRLYAVQMRTSTDVWAVGSDRSTTNGIALHYDGVNWTAAPLPSGTPVLYSLQLLGANDGWLVGVKGTILRLVNGAWTRVQGSGLPIGPVNAPDAYTRPIDATDANTVWWYGGSPGQLYQWKNGNVTAYTAPITSGLYALDMVSSTLGWAGTASLQGPNYLLRFSSGTWTAWPMTEPVDALSMIGPDEGWIKSGSGFHYLNGALIPEWVPGSSLSMLDSQHGWAIGNDNGVYSYTIGIWAPVTPTLKLSQLTSVHIASISPDEAWVAGFSESCDPSGCPVTPELHHFSGGAWTNIFSPTSPLPDDWLAFFNISKVSSTEWWATGKLKTLQYAFLRYKDGVYSSMSAAGEDVIAVSMLPDGTGFASGVGSVLQLIDLPNKVYLPTVRR